MKRESGRPFSHSHLAVGLVVLILAAPASAQSQGDQSTPSTQQIAEATPAQVPTAPITPPPAVQIARPYWTNNGGFEADTHDTGYGFFGPLYVKPFRPNMAVVAGANINYLYYEFASGSGHTNVRSPGVNIQGGMKFGGKNYLQLTAGPSFKRRHIDVRDAFGTVIGTSKDFQVGVNLGADLSVDPTSHNNLYGIADYNAVDQYRWNRLAYKEQVTNRHWSGKFAQFVGAEFIEQGNQDIHSTQVGALFEFVHVPSSVAIMLRGGYKRSTFQSGPDKTGPWVAIGFWQRLR